MSYRYVVVADARSFPYPTDYRSVDADKAYARALADYNWLVSRGRSALIYSSRGIHARSWKPQRARLVSHI